MLRQFFIKNKTEINKQKNIIKKDEFNNKLMN